MIFLNLHTYPIAYRLQNLSVHPRCPQSRRPVRRNGKTQKLSTLEIPTATTTTTGRLFHRTSLSTLYLQKAAASLQGLLAAHGTLERNWHETFPKVPKSSKVHQGLHQCPISKSSKAQAVVPMDANWDTLTGVDLTKRNEDIRELG